MLVISLSGSFILLAIRLLLGLLSSILLDGRERAKVLLYSLLPVLDGNLYAYLDGLLISPTFTTLLCNYPYPWDIIDLSQQAYVMSVSHDFFEMLKDWLMVKNSKF